MTKPLGFEKPLGMRDYLPDVLAKQRLIEKRINQCIAGWGYEEILTPSLEYYSTVGEASATLDNKLFKLLDRQGRTLVLRPDVTTPIARVASSLLRDTPRPLRLMYNTNVFRAQQNEAGRNAEFVQSGVELIGESSLDADAEVIALAISALQAAGLTSFKLVIGHVGFIEGLLEETVPNEKDREQLRYRLHHSDYVGFREDVEGLLIDQPQKTRLIGLLNLRGGSNRLTDAEVLTVNGRARKAIDDLQQLWKMLEAYEVTEFIMFDLNLLSSLDYYTGILFEGYVADQGWPVCGGGRYDQLLARFGHDNPSTGFAIKMDRLIQASTLQAERTKKRIGIIYDDETRMEAIRQARELRSEAIVVTSLEPTGAPVDELIDLRGGGGNG